MNDKAEFKQLLSDRYDPEELVSILEIPIYTLIDLLWEFIENNLDVFENEFTIDGGYFNG